MRGTRSASSLVYQHHDTNMKKQKQDELELDQKPKPWQHGYALDYLKQLEQRYARFNSFALGPFTEMKKHTIAQALYQDALEIADDYIVESRISKQSGPITAYLDTVIAYKERGDRVISSFVATNAEGRRIMPDALVERLRSYEEPTWLWVWQENASDVAIAIAAGFKFVASKITSFSEIRGLYFNFKERGLIARLFPKLHAAEHVGIALCDVGIDVSAARTELDHLGVDFANHYSKYNASKAWSAISLRGYRPEPDFITKPSEMNQKWQDEHATTEFKMQDTALRSKLRAIDAMHESISSLTNVHRIRLMQLAPGGGELQRHTDQTDKDSGVDDGKLMRFHYPIVTNDRVIFTSWDMRGQQQSVNMCAGEVWYLDTRKPHRAVNGGDSVRIHLVVDVEANDAVRSLLKKAIFER
jgi:Aspartyl/Asparaginyl beta-hydroxylase